jgi:hypothetical protein
MSLSLSYESEDHDTQRLGTLPNVTPLCMLDVRLECLVESEFEA